CIYSGNETSPGLPRRNAPLEIAKTGHISDRCEASLSSAAASTRSRRCLPVYFSGAKRIVQSTVLDFAVPSVKTFCLRFGGEIVLDVGKEPSKQIGKLPYCMLATATSSEPQ